MPLGSRKISAGVPRTLKFLVSFFCLYTSIETSMNFSFNILATLWLVNVSASNFLHHPQDSDLAYTNTGLLCILAASRAGVRFVWNFIPFNVILPVSLISDFAAKHPE